MRISLRQCLASTTVLLASIDSFSAAAQEPVQQEVDAATVAARARPMTKRKLPKLLASFATNIWSTT